ncbi:MULTISPECIES: hypothetical protein [unclassified Corynebacterium]|uniref:hypothetical protein n=1 Tax=unclassified Corynebacterium TaxID=2624378 RepID=UPI003523F590
MGRLILLLLIIVVIVLVWKAFGPGSWRTHRTVPAQPQIKGPDDDDEFLWNLKKQRFKERRAAEQAAREENERIRRARSKYNDEPDQDDGGDRGESHGPTDPDTTKQ